MDVKTLKLKVIDDFNKWIARASYGHHDNYSNILHTIAFIEVWNDIDNVAPIYQLLLHGDTL